VKDKNYSSPFYAFISMFFLANSKDDFVSKFIAIDYATSPFFEESNVSHFSLLDPEKYCASSPSFEE
jgi:hypothetical protein